MRKSNDSDARAILLDVFDHAFDKRSWHGANLADVALLHDVHRRLRESILSLPAAKLDPKRRWLIHGIAAHDLYHAGQIKLLRRLVQ